MKRLLLVLALVLAAPAQAKDVSLGVALQPLYSIAAALADGTTLRVEPVPPVLPGMLQLPRALSRANAALNRQLAVIDAVVAIASIWPDDPLFREARARNIRVVAIDAARSLAKDGSSVALIARPSTDIPWRPSGAASGESPYAWFAPSNGIRMADIVAGDLKRLAPADAGRIEENRVAFVAELQALRAEFEAKFAALPDPHVLALTDRFVYLTNEFSVYVDGYLLEDDVRWTAADFDGVKAFIAERGIRHVLHHWQPAGAIVQAIAEAGAAVVVLDDGEGTLAAPNQPPERRGYQALLRANLEALYGALVRHR